MTSKIPPYAARAQPKFAFPWLSSGKDIAEKTSEGDRKASHCEPHHDPVD
ncbi:MAG: hypothetical protein ACT4NY_05845 [Pseudonocardiales bacterium]